MAGTPLRYHYDRYTRTFQAAWSTARAVGPGRFRRGSRTTIAVPKLVFPRGYVTTVTGGRVVSRPGARVLVVKQAKGAKAVEVVVRAR